MVIGKFNIEGVSIAEDEADAPLIVDANAMLSGPVVLQCLKMISWRGAQKFQFRRRIDQGQFRPRPPDDISRNALGENPGEEGRGAVVGECLDHENDYICAT